LAGKTMQGAGRRCATDRRGNGIGGARGRGLDRPVGAWGVRVKIRAWRIFKPRHGASAFTGEGARRYGGRWNSKGVAVVYTAASCSLAALEMLVHLQNQQILKKYLVAEVSFDSRQVTRVDSARLP